MQLRSDYKVKKKYTLMSSENRKLLTRNKKKRKRRRTRGGGVTTAETDTSINHCLHKENRGGYLFVGCS